MRLRRADVPARRSSRAPVERTPHVAAVGVSVSLGGRTVLRGADVEARPGQVVALLGPNGAGKSTLLGVLAGDIAPDSGAVFLDGRPLQEVPPLELARTRAVLPQQVNVGFPFTVEEVVSMGRAPWIGTVAEQHDDAAVAAALDAADVAHLRSRPFPALSGGERARVALARVLAQDTPILLLDEPTAALDIHHTELVLGAVGDRVASGAAAVVVLHDLLLAAAHADHVVLLREGAVVAAGPPRQVLRAELLGAVYGHPIEVLDHPRTGRLLVLPEARTRPPTTTHDPIPTGGTR